MNYDELLKYLDTLVPREFRMELEPMSEACHIFGNPYNSYSSVHISGTNGKGSTAAFLDEILRGSGYKTGLLTSPHLIDVRERIKFGGETISKEDMIRLSEKIRSELPNEHFLSFFEFVTLLGFMYFQEKNVDIAIVETGLGGRLDATNVINPKVAVITSLSMDHQRHLGSTLKEITAEKCGIIKRGVSTVTAVQPEESMLEMRRWCDDVGSPLIVADPRDIKTPLGLLGEHQRQNAACAVEAANLLADQGFNISNVEASLVRTKWEGRLEILRQKPTVLLDGAHNLAGAESLARYVSSYIPREKAVLMIGILHDKDVTGICRTLVPLFRKVICVRAESSRATSPKDLAATARAFGADVNTGENIEAALQDCLNELKEDDTLVVSGSLHTVGAVRGILTK